MNIEHLKTFQEVVKLGSFSEVAKKLSITQPAVSFQIQKLEQQLGTRLIDRTQRAIALTAAGRRLLRFAESVEIEREQLLNDLEEMREEVSGELLLSASTIPGEYLLPPLLSAFKRMHPAVHVQVDISDSLTVIDGVRENRYEVGFCGVPPEGQDLKSFRIAEDEIVLIVPAEHPFANRSEIGLTDFKGEALIFREATSGTQRSLENALSEAGIEPEKWVPNLILGTTQAVVSAVAAGAGIALVSNMAIKQSVELGLVHQVRVREFQLSRYFYCIFREERVVTRLVDEFIGFIKINTSDHENRDQE